VLIAGSSDASSAKNAADLIEVTFFEVLRLSLARDAPSARAERTED
jgi:hypothetical protein